MSQRKSPPDTIVDIMPDYKLPAPLTAARVGGGWWGAVLGERTKRKGSQERRRVKR